VTVLLPIESLNQAPRSDFLSALKPLFEAAGPLGDALYVQRPFGSYHELLDAAEMAVQQLPREQQVAVVNAHPRIGENPTRVSKLSYHEQGYATEDPSEVAHVYEQLRQLNKQYEDRFGFRFVVFVNGRPKAAIVDVLRARLTGAADSELQMAVREMLAIARDRLKTLS
jgi:2-oxo-4-hydroxy-4-carboxy-5-ureidoimidazoline decarboxylase